MGKVAPFHSVREKNKPASERVHHTNDTQCAPGRDIPKHERVDGTGGYRICEHCAKL